MNMLLKLCCLTILLTASPLMASGPDWDDCTSLSDGSLSNFSSVVTRISRNIKNFGRFHQRLDPNNDFFEDVKDVGEELLHQLDEGDIYLCTFRGDIASRSGHANPLSGNIFLNERFLEATYNWNSSQVRWRFWALLSTLYHEGDHMDAWSGETSATRDTIRFFQYLIYDYIDCKFGRQNQSYLCQIGVDVPVFDFIRYANRRIAAQKRYQLSVNEISEDILDAFLEEHFDDDDGEISETISEIEEDYADPKIFCELDITYEAPHYIRQHQCVTVRLKADFCDIRVLNKEYSKCRYSL